MPVEQNKLAYLSLQSFFSSQPNNSRQGKEFTYKVLHSGRLLPYLQIRLAIKSWQCQTH